MFTSGFYTFCSRQCVANMMENLIDNLYTCEFTIIPVSSGVISAMSMRCTSNHSVKCTSNHSVKCTSNHSVKCTSNHSVKCSVQVIIL